MTTMSESDREQWLSDRRRGIGGSDAAPIVGISPWATALEVYGDKTGTLPPRQATRSMAWGLKLEEAIATAYSEETGRALEAPPRMLRHPERPWMLASIDRLSTDGRIVELKTASPYYVSEWGPAGTDQVPEYYLLQIAHYMEVADIGVADVAVLIGGNDFRIYTVERNQRLIDNLVEIEAAFWERVLTRRPPEPDWRHASTLELMQNLYGLDAEKTINMTDAGCLLVDGYERLGAAKREIDADRDALKAQILGLLAGASVGVLPDGRQITRKQVTRKEYTVPECTYMDMMIKQAKREKVKS